MRSGNERLGQQQAQAQREGQYDVNKQNYLRDVTVAGMSAPQLVQSSTTGTQQGNISQSQPYGPVLANMAGQSL